MLLTLGQLAVHHEPEAALRLGSSHWGARQQEDQPLDDTFCEMLRAYYTGQQESAIPLKGPPRCTTPPRSVGTDGRKQDRQAYRYGLIQTEHHARAALEAAATAVLGAQFEQH